MPKKIKERVKIGEDENLSSNNLPKNAPAIIGKDMEYPNSATSDRDWANLLFSLFSFFNSYLIMLILRWEGLFSQVKNADS